MKKKEKMVLMSVRLYKKDKKTISRAAKKVKASESAFVRSVALEQAQVLLY